MQTGAAIAKSIEYKQQQLRKQMALQQSFERQFLPQSNLMNHS